MLDIENLPEVLKYGDHARKNFDTQVRLALAVKTQVQHVDHLLSKILRAIQPLGLMRAELFGEAQSFLVEQKDAILDEFD